VEADCDWGRAVARTEAPLGEPLNTDALPDVTIESEDGRLVDAVMVVVAVS
jgi:hypothetical protein